MFQSFEIRDRLDVSLHMPLSGESSTLECQDVLQMARGQQAERAYE
jgi:hypothetical protein